ncbi:hypothetical protein [Secundilactobacillus kimchicus]|uniref:hypothetical protein n=1 Tax=Secundilactobacillus kimchicus TaxID=528209 RepID=UPI0024A8169C|nr:hypothetical protein [Secundilactobacillus kimchicus]
MSLLSGAMIGGKTLFENEDTSWEGLESELSDVDLYGFWRIKNGILFINASCRGNTDGNSKIVWTLPKQIPGYGTRFKIDPRISIHEFQVNTHDVNAVDHLCLNLYAPDTIGMETWRTDSVVGKVMWAIPLEEI